MFAIAGMLAVSATTASFATSYVDLAPYADRVYYERIERSYIEDFLEAAKAITPSARGVPPTHLQAPNELRFVIEVLADDVDDVAPRCRRIARARRREVLPVRSRPGFNR